jgi:hypothetical protein
MNGLGQAPANQAVKAASSPRQTISDLSLTILEKTSRMNNRIDIIAGRMLPEAVNMTQCSENPQPVCLEQALNQINDVLSEALNKTEFIIEKL